VKRNQRNQFLHHVSFLLLELVGKEKNVHSFILNKIKALQQLGQLTTRLLILMVKQRKRLIRMVKRK